MVPARRPPPSLRGTSGSWERGRGKLGDLREPSAERRGALCPPRSPGAGIPSLIRMGCFYLFFSLIFKKMSM